MYVLQTTLTSHQTRQTLSKFTYLHTTSKRGTIYNTYEHTQHTNKQVSYITCLKTCFSFFWQIHQASTTAQHMERFAVETNTIACHAVTLVCKQELVCCLCPLVCASMLSSVSAEFYSCLHRCATLSWRMGFSRLLIMPDLIFFSNLFHFTCYL